MLVYYSLLLLLGALSTPSFCNSVQHGRRGESYKLWLRKHLLPFSVKNHHHRSRGAATTRDLLAGRGLGGGLISSSQLQGRASVEDCAMWHGDGQGCRRNKCFYCCTARKCYPDASYGKGPGCYNYCDDRELCAAKGCVYDEDTKHCTGAVGSRKFSQNHCGETIVSSNNGVWYAKHENFANNNPQIPASQQKLQYNSNAPLQWYCNRNYGLGFSGRPASEPSVYQTQIISRITNVPGGGGMIFAIPILEDGDYKLVIHFSEIFASVERKTKILLNDVEVFRFSTSQLGQAFDHTVRFRITQSLSTLSFGATTVPAAGSVSGRDHARWNIKYVDINLGVYPSTYVDNYNPVCSGFYVEKLN